MAGHRTKERTDGPGGSSPSADDLHAIAQRHHIDHTTRGGGVRAGVVRRPEHATMVGQWPTSSHVLSERLAPAFAAVAGEPGVDPVVRPSDRADAQANGALALAKRLGRNPRDVASDVVAAADLDGVATAEIAGPGFINLTVDSRRCSARCSADVAGDDRLGIAADDEPPLPGRLLGAEPRQGVAHRPPAHHRHRRRARAHAHVPRPRGRAREPRRRLGSPVRDPHRATDRGRSRRRRRVVVDATPVSSTRWRQRGSPRIPTSPSGRGPGSSPCNATNPRRWPCGTASSS